MAFFYKNRFAKSRYFVEISQKIAKSLITQIVTDYTDGRSIENKEKSI
jgi:hypothetical protein